MECASAASSHRWFGVGHSSSSDPAAAAAAAVTAAVDGRRPSLLLVFSATGYDLPSLAAALRKQAGSRVVIAGCTAMAQVVVGGPADTGIAVIAIGGDGFSINAAISHSASGRQREAGSEAASCVTTVDRPHRVVVLLTDGLTEMMDDIVRGAHSVAGAVVPLVGGCASDRHAYQATYQFLCVDDETEICTDAVVGVAIGSDAPIGLGIAHGWHKQGNPMIATSCERGRVYELDEKPALDVYLERIGATEAMIRTPEHFRDVAFSKPLGMSRRSSEDIRVVHDANFEDRSIVCLAEVPQGALVWPMETDVEALIDAAAEACGESIDQLGAARPIGAIAFDCGARLVKLGKDGARREVETIAKVLGDTPFAGFYTFGEIARSQGSRGIHHLTFVSLVLA